jgi:hypothetical protein
VFAEDISAFFNTDDHAVTVTYTPPGYPHPGTRTTSAAAIFDANAVEVELGGAVSVRGTRSICVGAAADFPGYGEGAHITKGDKTYRASEPPETDETGSIVTFYLDIVN